MGKASCSYISKQRVFVSKLIRCKPRYFVFKHQTLLFSATMADGIRKLAQKILKNPAEISLSISKPAAGVDQKVYLAHDDQKVKIVAHLLAERKEFDSIIVFTSTKSKVSEIVKSLRKSGFPASGISSNLEQDMREEVLRGFRSKRIRILVATDVMSRGIDIKEINMVINYDVPHDAEDYVHRVGRTARANTKGEAVTLVNEKDMSRMRKIEELIEGVDSFRYNTSTDGNVAIVATEGGSIGDIYGRVWTGEVDADGVPIGSSAPDVLLGNAQPDWLGGWSNTLTYKDFSMSFLIDARMGGQVYSQTSADMDRNGVSLRSLQYRQSSQHCLLRSFLLCNYYNI